LSFIAPDNWLEIYDETISKTFKLIELEYIDNIDKGILRSWLNNFKTKEEKYFATIILNSLVYRNENAILSIFENIIHMKLPKIMNSLGLNINSIQELELMLKTPKAISSLNFCISTVEGVDKNIGKSGEVLNRLLKSKELIYKTINFNIPGAKNKPKKINTIIFIDDIVGTGSQFIKFYKKYKNKIEWFDNIIYLPLVAYQEGIEKIKKFNDSIIIEAMELLDKKDTFFYNDNEKFDKLNTITDLEDFYNELINKNNLNVNSTEYDLNTLYFFKISSPNNNLPLVYYSNESWNKLFLRF